jgi:hypothetical protein
MSKHGKVRAVPPPQSRGIIRQMPVPPGAPPVAVQQEISELDALKYRLAIQKDNNVKGLMNALEDKKKILAQEQENLQLRINLIRMENKRDIGHMDIGQGDRLVEEGGKWFILRAPRRGPMPQIGKPASPAAKPADAPPESEEEGVPDGIDEGEPGLDETHPDGEMAPEAGEAAPVEPTPDKK